MKHRSRDRRASRSRSPSHSLVSSLGGRPQCTVQGGCIARRDGERERVTCAGRNLRHAVTIAHRLSEFDVSRASWKHAEKYHADVSAVEVLKPRPATRSRDPLERLLRESFESREYLPNGGFVPIFFEDSLTKAYRR